MHEQLKPAAHLRRPEAPQGRQEHQRRAELQSPPRRLRQGLRRGRAQVRARVPAPRRCCTCRSSRSPASATTRTPTSRSTTRRRGRRSCAPRSPACSAGRRTRCAIKVPYLGSGYGSKLYIKLEALALALSMIARKPVKIAYTFEEMFYQITRHPSTFRIKSGVDKDGKIVARKCEVFWNGGAYADIGPRVTQKSGLTAVRPVRHRQRLDRFLRALHQRHAVRRAARLRRAAARVGLRGPHRHDGARAEDGPGRVPPEEPGPRRRARTPPARS